MEITFWGVRGSIPAAGPEFNRYGGNTCCVSIRAQDGTLLILDAGTGITVLGRTLMEAEFGQGRGSATLLLSHGHWDHIQGFPFFPPAFVPGNRFSIYGPSESPIMVEGILEGQMNPHFSPVHSLRNLGAEIQFRAVQEGSVITVGGMTIMAHALPHGRYSALAFRLEEKGCSVVYAPDAGYPTGDLSPQIHALFDNASFLIHDTNYSPEDQAARRDRGHSSISDAARVATRCRVKTLVMIHYDQDYTDSEVDRLARRCRALLDAEPDGHHVHLIAAEEGLTISC
jgi:phosphoribosyl 1,2-cyclic phosphodiesterase